jgi:hypothetical protein
MKSKRNWFNILCIIMITCNLIGLVYGVKVDCQREKLNQRYEELIELRMDQYRELERSLKDLQLLKDRLWSLLNKGKE